MKQRNPNRTEYGLWILSSRDAQLLLISVSVDAESEVTEYDASICGNQGRLSDA